MKLATIRQMDEWTDGRSEECNDGRTNQRVQSLIQLGYGIHEIPSYAREMEG